MTLFLVVSIVGCNDHEEKKAVEKEQQSAKEASVEKKSETNIAGVTTAATDDNTKDCQLTLGWDVWEPYLYTDRLGKVAGLDVDIFKEVAKIAGCELKFEQGDWAGLLAKLKKGEIDVLSGASATESRKDFAWFSEPYRSESFVLYVKADDFETYASQSFKSLIDSGIKIGAVVDYFYGDTVSAYQDAEMSSKQFVYSQIDEGSFSLLLDSKVNAVLEDPFVGTDVIRRKGWIKDLRKLPIILHSGEVYFMFSKSSVDEKTLTKIDAALAKMRADGSYHKIMESYGGE